jgi:hypothetical protein
VQASLALAPELLVLKLGPDLLQDSRFIPLEPGFIRLIEGLDLLLGDETDLRGDLGLEQRLYRKPPFGRSLSQ